MNFRFSLLSVILILSFNSYSQPNIDSLKNLLSIESNISKEAKFLSKLCISYTYINADSSIYYGERYLTLSKNISFEESDLNDLYYNLGTAYLDKNLSKSHFFYKHSYNYSLTTNNDSLIAANHLALAAYYSRIPNIDSNSYHTTSATKHFKAIGDSIGLASCYFNLMSNYNDIKKHEKSIYYGEMGYEIAKVKKLEPLLTYFTIIMGFNYLNIEGKELLAEEFINKAKKIAIESNNVSILTNIYMTLGAQKMKNKEYLSAIDDFNEVIKYSYRSNDSVKISIAYNSIGKAFYNLNSFDKAAENFKKDLFINKNVLKGIQSNYLHLSMIYSNKNENLHHYYLNKYDSISTVITETTSEEILAQYESSEKERQIELLKLKETESELIIQKKNFRNTLLVSALLFLVFIIAFLYYRNKNKQKILNQEIELEKQKVTQTENELGLKLEALKNNNSLISELKNKLKDNSNNDQLLNSIISSFEESYVSEKQWDNIIHQFNNLENDFVNQLKSDHSAITKNDIKLSILMKLNYSNSGMAEILNISVEGIKKAKQRLKKKKDN